MTRRKVFIAFAAAVMILVLTAALFVACDQTKTYTVTFKNGEAVIKTVSVQDGATIADADVPADLEDTDDAVFEGWFNGEVAFDKTAAITGDVTYTAKWTSLFTVTFKDGDEVIATAKVKDGEKIADADIPADLADTADAAFEGWFNGDSAFDKDAAITANVTYNAKWTGLFNVTFMNGDRQVKAAKVKTGEKIAEADIPEDPTYPTAEYVFAGWFNGDVEFDADATVTANVVYTAKWNKVAYAVKFVNGDDVVKTSYIAIAEDAKLSADDIADAQTKAGYVFLGYYDGVVKAEADLAVTSDRTFKAGFANEDSYSGYWINTDEHLMLTIGSDGKVSFGKVSNKIFTYNSETGTLKYSSGFGYSRVAYEIIAFDNYAVVTESGYDYTDEPYTTTTVLERKADAGLAAFYTLGRNKQFIVEDNGIISGYGSSALRYGWFYSETVDGATVYHFDFVVSTSLVQMTATIDAQGNYVLTGSNEYKGIYGKDVDGITYYGDSQYIYGLVGDNSTTYVYVDANKDSHYATISGDLAVNSIITVTYDDNKSVVFTVTKLPTATADGGLKQASAERGTYSGAKGDIVLDGFGKATVDGAAYTYYINAAKVVVLSNDTNTIGITIDSDAGTYVEKTADGKAQSYKQNGSTYYTLQLDGFGGANYIYKSSYSSSVNYGSYEFSSDGAQVTLKNVSYSVNGTYNIQDEGKVLVESSSEKNIFIANGYTVTTHEEDFVGYYVDADENSIEITIEDGRIWLAIDGYNKQLTKNWNGSALTYKATDTDAGAGFNTSSATYTLTLVDGNVVISHDCIQSYDSISEDYVIEKKSTTYTKTEKPFAFPESARGTWYLTDNTVVEIAEKSITVGGIVGTDYNQVSSFGGINYEFAINGTKYIVYEDYETAGKWYYCAADSYDAIELSKTQHGATLDAFAGSWTRTDNNSKHFVFTFDGQGTLTVACDDSYYNGKTASYKIVDNKVTLSDFASYDWTFTLVDANTITVTTLDSDNYTCPDFANGNITKQSSEESGDAISSDMQGTFTGTNGYTTNYTLIVSANSIVYKEVDTTWGVDVNETITDYTISDDGWTITWTISGTTYKFSNPTGYAFKLYIGSDDYTLTQA